MRGEAIADGPIPFISGAKADKMKQRYWIRDITPTRRSRQANLVGSLSEIPTRRRQFQLGPRYAERLRLQHLWPPNHSQSWRPTADGVHLLEGGHQRSVGVVQRRLRRAENPVRLDEGSRSAPDRRREARLQKPAAAAPATARQPKAAAPATPRSASSARAQFAQSPPVPPRRCSSTSFALAPRLSNAAQVMTLASDRTSSRRKIDSPPPRAIILGV